VTRSGTTERESSEQKAMTSERRCVRPWRMSTGRSGCSTAADLQPRPMGGGRTGGDLDTAGAASHGRPPEEPDSPGHPLCSSLRTARSLGRDHELFGIKCVWTVRSWVLAPTVATPTAITSGFGGLERPPLVVVGGVGNPRI
jgi:hypothetical protein